MKSEDRALAQGKLDREQRYFRLAGKKALFSPRWLKRVRLALGVEMTEIARELHVHRTVIYRLEESEDRKGISLRALEKVADAMGCRLVYAIVPRGGKTLMELAEQQRWRKKLKES